jgi:hypothetical protein
MSVTDQGVKYDLKAFIPEYVPLLPDSYITILANTIFSTQTIRTNRKTPISLSHINQQLRLK